MKRSFTFERCIDYGDDHGGDVRDAGLIMGLENPLEKGRQPTPVFFPGESQGQRSLAGYSV